MTLTKKEMGYRIKEARKIKSKNIGKRYTQIMLAKDLGFSRGYIGDIENGGIYPNYVVLSNICNTCNISLGFFDDKNKYKEGE